MKMKFFCLFLLFAGINNLSAYKIRIFNNTDTWVKVQLQLAATFCKDKMVNVAPYKDTQTYHEVNVGVCCTKMVIVSPIKRSAAGSSGSRNENYYMEPLLTGFGIACRGFDIYISKLADGTLHLSPYE